MNKNKSKDLIKVKKPRGRPSIYTPELADEICDAISSSEKGLAHLCEANPHWPARQHIFVWLRKYPDFYDKYTRAKENQVEVCVDYMQELMSEPHKFVDEETGRIRVDVQMLRTKMDAIKWQAGKLKPKKYGESRQEEINHSLHEDVIKRKHELDEKNKKEF
jgi:terminase small subunit-like protein